MKYLITLFSLFVLQGCLYFNDRGVSAHLYDNCHSYYDCNGNFIEKCDDNIIDYDEAKDGIIAIKNEIGEKFDSLSDSCGCKNGSQNIENQKSNCQ